MKKPLLNVALLGMNSKSQSTFTYFVRKHASQYLQLAEPQHADVCIVDFDTEGGIKQWYELCFSCQRPAILLSERDPQKDCAIWVKKPVSSQAMEKAVSQLLKLAGQPPAAAFAPASTAPPATVAAATAEAPATARPQLQVVTEDSLPPARQKAGYQQNFSDSGSPNLSLSRKEIIECCGSQIDGDPASARFRELASFDERKTLLRPLKKAVQLAREKNAAVEVFGLPTPLVVMAGGERIFVDLANPRMRHICAMPMQAMPVIKPLPISLLECEKRYPLHHRHMHLAETVIWQIALWASRGRLPQSLAPDQPVQLDYWPNFTRLTVTPHALAIASLWVNHSLSAVEVAEKMQVPQRYVFALASAASSTGLLQQSAQAQRSAEVNWKKPQAFFNTILRSLKIA